MPMETPPIYVRQLQPDDAATFKALRLAGLAEAPSAFLTSFDEERAGPVEDTAAKLGAGPHSVVFGAFEADVLIATAGVARMQRARELHKAVIWGVYVAPAHRRRGAGRAVMQAALDHAFNTLGVRQVNLGVNANNPAALTLYESLGFTTFGVEKAFMMIDGVPHDEVHMVCVNGRAK